MSIFFGRIVNSLPVRISCHEIYFSKIQDKSLCVRWYRDVDVAKRVPGKTFRRIVHYPDKYTIKPLNVTNLAGRDPVSGVVVYKGLGGGIKHKYHWIDWKRVGPTEGPPLVERVIQIIVDGCRTAHVALVGRADKLRYILATENMKAGDLIKTSCEIPRIPVRANEGDAHPLGALPVGSIICCVEKFAGLGSFFAHSAGSSAKILRHAGNRVIIQLPSKHEVSLPKECMAVMGKMSNVLHGVTPIGSPNRLRELGYRPRSGLWHRKDGRHGRKLRKPPPIKEIEPIVSEKSFTMKLSLSLA